jgi:hypothetical protein
MLQEYINSDQFDKAAEILSFESLKRWNLYERHSDDITALVLDISAK